MLAKKPEEYLVDPATVSIPDDIQALPGLLEKVAAGINDLVSGVDMDRQELLVNCRSMLRAIQTPRETMVEHCWAQVSTQYQRPS